MGKSYAKQSVQIAGMSFQTRSRQITLKGITDMRILLIEDNIELCTSLSYQLKAEGFELDICHNGEDGLHFIKEEAHDLILLDRMLPRMDGITVLRSTRRLNISTPIILITALGELQDRIIGLDCGADDYIVKPFAFEELTARIRCIFRRPQKWKNSQLLHFGDISYDTALRELTCGPKVCSLSKREGELLGLFLRNRGQTLPRLTILSRVWGPDAGVEEGNLDNYIHFLRRRLTSAGSRLCLKTIRGVGYCLEDTNV